MIKKRKPPHPGVLLYEEVLKPLGLTNTTAESWMIMQSNLDLWESANMY